MPTRGFLPLIVSVSKQMSQISTFWPLRQNNIKPYVIYIIPTFVISYSLSFNYNSSIISNFCISDGETDGQMGYFDLKAKRLIFVTFVTYRNDQGKKPSRRHRRPDTDMESK